MARDPYDVLGVAPTATPAEITVAYRRLVRELHPDTDGHADGHADPRRLAEVLAAYRMLRDPQRRATHDHERSQHESRRGSRPVPVRVHRRSRQPANPPDLRAGPVRRHR